MILITGAAGYIGGHCALKFIQNGYDVVIFDSLELGHIETIETLKKVAKLKGTKLEFIKGDLKNINDINPIFEKFNIEGVVHFAAYSLVQESVFNPSKYYRNNVFGTLNLLDKMIENNVKKIVFSSTCATYGNPKYTPIDENHPQDPINSYGASKLVVERIMKDYEIAYGLKSIKLRYFNVAGCDVEQRIGEWHETETHLIPNILKSTFEKEKTFKIFGDDYDTPDGTCIRDYVNVEDLADAHLLAFEYLKKANISDVFNLGTQNGDSVKKIFETCQKVLNKKIDVEIVERREGDPAKLFANSKKALEKLSWKPKRTIEESIESAYNWEKKLQEMLKVKL